MPSSSYPDGDEWQAIDRFMNWHADNKHVDPVVAMIDHYIGFYANDERYKQTNIELYEIGRVNLTVSDGGGIHNYGKTLNLWLKPRAIGVEAAGRQSMAFVEGCEV